MARWRYLVAGAVVVALLAACGGGEPVAAPPTASLPTPRPPTVTPPEPPPTSAPTTVPTAAAPTTALGRPDTLERGDSGPAVLALQRRLSGLGYWLGTPDGVFGHLTEQAVLALQGAAGLSRDGVVGARTLAALEDGAVPRVRSAGRAVEVDLDAGTLTFVRDGRPATVLHTSTGTFEEYTVDGRTRLADTPRGAWQVTWAYDGWRTSDLGRLYRPRYFHRDGIAVHGYPSVPAYPASHGCVRVSNAAMDMIWRERLMPVATPVLVF